MCSLGGAASCPRSAWTRYGGAPTQARMHRRAWSVPADRLNVTMFKLLDAKSLAELVARGPRKELLAAALSEERA